MKWPFPRLLSPFDRLVLAILLGLGLLLAGVVVAGWWAEARLPVSGSVDQAVGSRGPFELRFEQEMQPESVEERIEITPSVAGKFTWEGSKVRFWPAMPLEIGSVYRITLRPGSKSASGRVINRVAAWDFTVRSPSVVFVHPADQPDLWIYAPEGRSLKQLTRTGGKVFDYGASTGGDHIILSVMNAMDGIDLWLYMRATGSMEKLLDCGKDWCFNPAWSPADDKIAYVRRSAGEGPGSQPGIPRVFILDSPSRIDHILYGSEKVAGTSPAWSPDGRYLAFFDTLAGGIRIFDLETGKAVVIQTQSGLMGTWSPDSRRLALLNFQQAASGRPYSAVYFFTPQDQRLEKFLPDDQEQFDYSVPSWSPDGEWLALAFQPSGASPSKQIWLMRPDGSQAQAVTGDENFTHAAYSFSPDGGLLVYQRISLSASQARPELMVWQRDSGEAYSISEDAALPAWLP
ncbi:MAG: hypothetical protein HPY59_15325 [Anaerolineae bacterium]|nr:hypothetical protein [Anaerolineae bacterium]